MLISPVDIAIVLAPCCPFPAELDAREDAFLPFHFANKLDGSVHTPRHIHLVADGQTISSEAFVTGYDRCHCALICQWT